MPQQGIPKRSVTLQRAKAKDYLDPGLFVTEYTDEYVKKHANREPSKRHIYDRRSGIKPDWLKEIENRPAPQINDADLFHTRSASLFKDDFKRWDGTRPTHSVQLQQREEEWQKIKDFSGSTKLTAKTAYDESVNSSGKNWRPAPRFDPEKNINTMTSYQHPSGSGKLFACTSQAQDYKSWGSKAFPERSRPFDRGDPLAAKFDADSEYKSHFGSSKYTGPKVHQADKSLVETGAPLYANTTYRNDFTKSFPMTGNPLLNGGTAKAREILEGTNARHSWRTSPAPQAPDPAVRGQQQAKVAWAGKKRGYVVHTATRSPIAAADCQPMEKDTTYRIMTRTGPHFQL